MISINLYIKFFFFLFLFLLLFVPHLSLPPSPSFHIFSTVCTEKIVVMPSIRTNIHIMPAFGHIFFTTSHNLGYFYCQRFSLHRGATKTFSQNEVISNFRDNQNLNCWHLVQLQKQIFFRENTRTNISVTSLILAIPRYALPVVVLAVEDAWLTKNC